MKQLYIIFLFHLLFGCQSYSQLGVNDSAIEKIDKLFEHINSTTPGYMIGVIQDSKFIFEKGYGMANLEYNIPNNPNSAFNIASLSKQFTAACIALLIQEGKVTLEDNIKMYISEFPDYKYEVQIKHLVYMTSGINDYYYNERKNGTDWSSLNFFSIDTAITASLSNAELMYEPGTQWSYSNINYMLLTKVVENVSGLRFSQFAKERLFNPLDMSNSCVNDDIFQVIPNRVYGYNYRDDENTSDLIENGYLKAAGSGFLQINRNSPHYGGSGVFTTMNDISKWVNNFQTKSFGGEEFYNLMHSTMQFEHDKSNDAFGLVLGDFNGHDIVWYEGGDWGFSSYMMRFPKNNLTLVCFSNIGTGNARNYVNQIMDILMDEGVIELK